MSDNNKNLNQSLITIKDGEDNTNDNPDIDNDNINDVNRDSINCEAYYPKIKNVFEDSYMVDETETDSINEYINLSGYKITKRIFNMQKIKEICLLAFPISLFFSCLFLQQTINIIFIGHYFTDLKEKENAIDTKTIMLFTEDIVKNKPNNATICLLLISSLPRLQVPGIY